jgi:hypothetical protein
MIDYTQLSPKDLFYTMREAYLKGDMESVKEMAKVSRSRTKTPLQENWLDACDEVDSMKFPDDIEFYETRVAESHDQKKGTHQLLTYRNAHTMCVKDFELTAKYNVCPKCDNEVRNKQLCLFNNELHQAHEKWFKYQGEDVEGKDIFKIAKDLFAY